MFKAKAGPVEYETQQAATLLRDLLAELQRKRAIVLDRLSETYATETFYIDAVRSRDEAMTYGEVDFVGSIEGYS